MNTWKTSNGTIINRVLTTNMPLLISEGENYILVDTGRTRARNGVLKKLDEILGDIELSLIILTHTHHDHIENLAQVLDNHQAKVLVHNSEVGFLDMIENRNNIIVFDEKYDLNIYGIDGFVLHTPGHSQGSSSIVINEEIAIIGDTLGDFYTKPYAKNPKKVSDEILRSVAKLIDLECIIYIPTYKKKVYDQNELKEFYTNYLNGVIIRD